MDSPSPLTLPALLPFPTPLHYGTYRVFFSCSGRPARSGAEGVSRVHTFHGEDSKQWSLHSLLCHPHRGVQTRAAPPPPPPLPVTPSVLSAAGMG